MDELHTSAGTVEFLWDGDGSLLITLEPDDPNLPHTFELRGELHARVSDVLEEGVRVEVDYVAVEHEVIDPDSGPSESQRAEVRDIRVV